MTEDEKARASTRMWGSVFIYVAAALVVAMIAAITYFAEAAFTPARALELGTSRPCYNKCVAAARRYGWTRLQFEACYNQCAHWDRQ